MKHAAWLLLLLVGIFGPSTPVYAVEPDAPPIVLHDGIAFRNVVEPNDLLIVFRYLLPEGSEESPAWNEFGVAGVLFRLLNPAPPSLQDRPPKRLGHGLSAFYLPSAAGLWGSGLIVRAQGNPSLFSETGDIDRSVLFNAAGADSMTLVIESDARRAALCEVFHGLLEEIEQADFARDSGDLVAGGVATEEGTRIVTDAFSGAVSLLPGCFQVGVTGSGVEFDPPEGELVIDRVAAVEATMAWQSWESLFSSNAQAVVTATFIGIGVVFGVWIAVTAWKGIMLGMGSAVIAGVGTALWVPHYLTKIIFVVILIGVILASAFWWRQLPRG